MVGKSGNDGTIWRAMLGILLAVNVVLVGVGANWIRSAIDGQALAIRDQAAKIEKLDGKVTEVLVKAAEQGKDIINHEARLDIIESYGPKR